MNGSNRMIYKANALFLLLHCSMSSSFAEEQIADEIMPSMAFLEFIGEWETDEGEWVDPLDLEREETGKLIETISEKNIYNDTDNEN